MDKQTSNQLYYLRNREKIKERRKQRYRENKEKELERIKQYYNEHKENIALYHKQYQEANSDKIKKYKQEYYSQMHGRALRLIEHYKREDIKRQRGDCTLSEEWIISNILTKTCHYCGETDWMKLGCDRIDNSKPHTQDNCVPCCFECNRKRGIMPYEDFKQKMQGN